MIRKTFKWDYLKKSPDTSWYVYMYIRRRFKRGEKANNFGHVGRWRINYKLCESYKLFGICYQWWCRHGNRLYLGKPRWGSALTTTAGTPTGLSYSTNTPLAGGTVKVQTGIEAASKTTVNLYNTTTGYLGSSSAATNFRLNLKNLNTIANAASAITEIDLAITQVASYQSAVGATQNIMTQETTLNNNLTTANTSAYSKLTSVDIAKETAKLAAAKILQDSSAAMIAQANQLNKDIVSTLLYQFTR